MYNVFFHFLNTYLIQESTLEFINYLSKILLRFSEMIESFIQEKIKFFFSLISIKFLLLFIYLWKIPIHSIKPVTDRATTNLNL